MATFDDRSRPVLAPALVTGRDRRSKHRTAASALVAAALLMAACGSADETDAAPNSVTSASTTSSLDAAAGDNEGAETATGDDADQSEVASPTTAVAAPPTISDASTSSTAATAAAVAAPIELPRPASAVDMAAALSEAELAVRDTTATPEQRAAWGQRQQQLYRLLSGNEGWVDEVLAGVDPSVATAVSGNWAARVELDFLLRQHKLGDTLPAWRVDAPLPADELLSYYREAGERHGVPWEVLAAINLIETRMGRISGISTAGAQGPMQFLPTTWAECCEGDPTNDRDAINGAAKYLIDRGGATNLDRAIFGYNNSDRYVGAVTGYAAVLADDPEAYYGYHGWQVYFATTEGLALLPEGYEETESVDAAAWLAANPERHLKIDS